MNNDGLAQLAYEAYRETMIAAHAPPWVYPPWRELGKEVKAAWHGAAVAVRVEVELHAIGISRPERITDGQS